MQEMPDLNETGKRQFYPRMQLGRPMSTDQLAKRISRATTFGEGEVKGILIALAKEMAWGMQEGQAVKIDGVGTFSLSLGVVKHADAEGSAENTRRNARSIRVRGVNFRADKELVSASDDGLELKRTVDIPIRTAKTADPASRLASAHRYLDEHAFMTVADYRALTGLAITAARMELRRLSEEEASGIRSVGRAPHRVYVKR